MKPRLTHANVALVLTLLFALAATTTAEAKPSPRKQAMRKVNAYLGGHAWAKRGSLRKCQRRGKRVVCHGTVRGGRRTCRVKVIVKHKQVKLRRGKCRQSRPNTTARASLSASLGEPGRQPLDPFEVAYPQEAEDTTTTDPRGVLSLYVDGLLECAGNVSGARAQATCSVDYAELGSHKVTTIYTSGSESAADTLVHNVEPLATSTTLSASFSDSPPEELPEKWRWRVGTLSVNGNVQPKGVAALSCAGDATGRCITAEMGDSPVYARVGGWDSEDLPIFEASIAEGRWWSLADIGSGFYFLRAAGLAGAGYLSSTAIAPVAVQPQWLPGFFRSRDPSIAATDTFAQLVAMDTYTKRSSDSILRLRAQLETASSADCRFQLRVDGQPASVGDDGDQVTTDNAKADEVFRDFSGVTAGPASIELWARYVGAEADPTCGLHEALFIVSEQSP